MSVLLDTSVLLGVEQGQLSLEQIHHSGALSVVTVEELWLGVLMTPPALQALRRRTFERAHGLYDLLPVSDEVARACAEIRAEGRGRQVRYAPFDSLIGATARVHGLTLLTQDEGMRGMLGVDVVVL